MFYHGHPAKTWPVIFRLAILRGRARGEVGDAAAQGFGSDDFNLRPVLQDVAGEFARVAV